MQTFKNKSSKKLEDMKGRCFSFSFASAATDDEVLQLIEDYSIGYGLDTTDYGQTNNSFIWFCILFCSFIFFLSMISFFSIKMQIYFTDNSANKSNKIHYKHIKLNVSNKVFPSAIFTISYHFLSTLTSMLERN